MTRPFAFIGSSAEGLEVAKAIQANLERSCESQIWSQGVFGVSDGTLSSVVKKLAQVDFAILAITPDDLTESRGEGKPSPRDNVILELGLCIGELGVERTFMVVDRGAEVKLPSDLAGITPATFTMPIKSNLQAALGPACSAVEYKIKELGLRLVAPPAQPTAPMNSNDATPAEEVAILRALQPHEGTSFSKILFLVDLSQKRTLYHLRNLRAKGWVQAIDYSDDPDWDTGPLEESLWLLRQDGMEYLDRRGLLD